MGLAQRKEAPTSDDWKGPHEMDLLGGASYSSDKPAEAGKQAAKLPLDFLSKAEELSLTRLWVRERNPSAAERIVLAYRPLVEGVARKLGDGRGTDEDLVSEGNIGLLRALETFDPERGFRFSAYAVFWVRARIIAYVRSNKSVVRPSRRNGPAQSDDIIDDELEPDNVTVDERIVTDIEVVHLRDRLDDILHVVLDERERHIFTARHLSDEASTLQQIGDELGISGERVRQIDAAAHIRVMRAAENKKAARLRPAKDKLHHAMALHYMRCPRTRDGLEAVVAGSQKRFPHATQADRIQAHQIASAMHAKSEREAWKRAQARMSKERAQ